MIGCKSIINIIVILCAMHSYTIRGNDGIVIHRLPSHQCYDNLRLPTLFNPRLTATNFFVKTKSDTKSSYSNQHDKEYKTHSLGSFLKNCTLKIKSIPLYYWGIIVMLLMVPLELILAFVDPPWQYKMPTPKIYSQEYDRGKVNISQIMSKDYSSFKKMIIKTNPEENCLYTKKKILGGYPLVYTFENIDQKEMLDTGIFIFQELPDKVRITFKSLLSVSVIGFFLGLYLVLLGIINVILVDYGMGVFIRVAVGLFFALFYTFVFKSAISSPGRFVMPIESNFHYMMVYFGVEK